MLDNSFHSDSSILVFMTPFTSYLVVVCCVCDVAFFRLKRSQFFTCCSSQPRLSSATSCAFYLSRFITTLHCWPEKIRDYCYCLSIISKLFKIIHNIMDSAIQDNLESFCCEYIENLAQALTENNAFIKNIFHQNITRVTWKGLSINQRIWKKITDTSKLE